MVVSGFWAGRTARSASLSSRNASEAVASAWRAWRSAISRRIRSLWAAPSGAQVAAAARAESAGHEMMSEFCGNRKCAQRMEEERA